MPQARLLAVDDEPLCILSGHSALAMRMHTAQPDLARLAVMAPMMTLMPAWPITPMMHGLAGVQITLAARRFHGRAGTPARLKPGAHG